MNFIMQKLCTSFGYISLRIPGSASSSVIFCRFQVCQRDEVYHGLSDTDSVYLLSSGISCSMSCDLSMRRLAVSSNILEVGPKPTPVFQRIDLEAWQGK